MALEQIGMRRLALILILIWTFIIGASFYLIRSYLYETAEGGARLWARAFIEKDIIYRHWASRHGGVYVPVTTRTQPNAYLSVHERDIASPAGRLLTLMNPAYMTRQVYELAAERGGIRGHITSLKPIRPENRPDDWERSALIAFENGVPEHGEMVLSGEKRLFRLMQPFVTEEACLKCHAQQGYKVGDIRGGISVSVPIDPFYNVAEEKSASVGYFHLLIWLIGSLSLVLYEQNWSARRIERRAWEGALLESEARYRVLAENAPIGIMQTDREGQCLFVNKKWSEIAGVPAVSAGGCEWLSEIRADERERIAQAWTEAVASGRPFDAVYTFGQDDRAVTVHSIAVPIFGEGGKVEGYIGTTEDITARRTAGEMLRVSEQRLGLVFDNISDLLILMQVEPEGEYRILSANRTFFSTLSYAGFILPHEAILGRSLHDVMETLELDSEMILRSRERFRSVVAGCAPMTYEQSFALPAGDFYGSITLIPILGDNGACTHLLWSCRNLTSRMRMLQNLLESEAKYAYLFNNMIDGFALIEMIFDEDGNHLDYVHLDVNPAFEKIMGRPRECFVGRSLRDINSIIDSEWLEFCGHIATGAQPRHFDRYEKDIDKHLEGYVYSPKHGQCVLIISDVSEQRRIEREKKALEEQLLQSQKMEAVGQLAGGVAHDFNNILTSIISNAYVLKKKTSGNDPSAVFLDEILSESGRAANLTKGLLAFSRKQALALLPVSVNAIVSKISGLLSRLIGEDIAISIELSPHDITVLADEGQVEQVIMNLATNARDAMPDGGILLIETGMIDADSAFFRTHAIGDARRYAVIRIRDTGIGIDLSVLDKIFEPFFTTKDVGKGTGLGLSIAYGIIKQHRGYIDVQSEVGNGTCFSVYLPAVGVSSSAPSDTKRAVGLTGTETILLAEDEASVRNGTRKVLEAGGYSVLEAKDGEEALALFHVHQEETSLVILDVIMPRMSGKAVADAIKAIRPDARIMFTSGYTADAFTRAGLEETGAHFIPKPCQPDELLRRVRDILDA